MKPLLIAVEGLGLSLPYFDANYLRTELLPKIVGAEIQTYSWVQNPTINPAAGQKLIIIGHSFGAAEICDRNVQADLVVTIDPRWSGFETFSVTPKNGSKWINYYERELLFNLPGDAVNGSTADFLVTGYSHVQMPGYPPIAAYINNWIKENS